MRYLTPAKATVYLLLVITLISFFSIGRVGLTVDEAHYALYGKFIDFSYFDHPPMVGWIEYLIEHFSQSNAAIRLPGLIFNILTSALLYYFCRRFFKSTFRWQPFVSVLLFQTAIAFHGLGLLFLPETPFIFFGLLSFCALCYWAEKPSILRAVGYGGSLGLAGLCNYTAFLLPIIGLIYVCFQKPLRPYAWHFILAGFTGLIAVSPVLYWNLHHGLISFLYQWHHVLHSEAINWPHFFASLFEPFFVYSPILYMGGLIALTQFSSTKNLSKNPVAFLCALASVILLGFFVYSSLHEFTLPHWPALGWLLITPVVAEKIVSTTSRLFKILFYGSLAYSIVLMLLLHALLLYNAFPFPIDKQPFHDVYGWRTAAIEAKALATSGDIFFVPNWTLASRIAWYGNMPIKVMGEDGNASQFALWFGVPQTGEKGIVVLPYGSDPQALLQKTGGYFESCTLLKSINIVKHNYIVNQFQFYHCRGYHDA
jgi:hypothetical protein